MVGESAFALTFVAFVRLRVEARQSPKTNSMTKDGPELKRPADFNAEDLETIRSLIEAAGEVDAVQLSRRLSVCQLIGVFRQAGKIVAAGALKQVRSEYNSATSIRSGFEVSEKASEFGYAVTNQDFRGRGYASRIAKALLATTGAPVFAITRVDNSAMIRSLQKAEMERVGNAWPSLQNPNSRLCLWVRSS